MFHSYDVFFKILYFEGSSHDAAAVTGDSAESLEAAPNYEKMTLGKI